LDRLDPTTEDRDGDRYLPMYAGGRLLPEKISSLRRKLYQKAKREPGFRFYALYDRIHRPDLLRAGWDLVRARGGAAGADGVTIEQIEASPRGPDGLVEDLHEELRTKRYRPRAVRRVYIPKPDGRQRPLGIPTIRDRVVQTAALLVLEPIFEADFEDSSYGFRPRRSAHDALAAVRDHLKAGRREVYDADLKSYFDTIPHAKLMASLRCRITDRSVLRLIRLWLETPVEEEDEGGGPKVHRPEQGTPQGGVISPLLANVYLHWLDRLFHRPDGPASWGAGLVRYADDFVILARRVDSRLQGWVEALLEGRMGLTINREKTRVVNLAGRKTSFDFLGFTFRYDRDLNGRGHRYLYVGPSRKAMRKERTALKEMTGPRQCFVPLPELIRRLNRHLRGWANYFRWGHPRRSFRAINHHVRERLETHVNRRSQRPFHLPEGQTYYAHFARMGLVRL
jgi:RNA-directed DNA polymerase